MRLGLREQARLRHLAEEHAPRLGGIVEDGGARDAPCHLEDLDKALAEAFRLPAHHRDAEARVQVRERHSEQLEPDALPGQGAREDAVVRLHRPGRPVELEEAAARRLQPGPHEAADGRIGSRAALPADEPAEDPLRAVALLSGGRAVLDEYARDEGGVAADGRPLPLLGYRRLRGEVLHRGVLVHDVAARAERLRGLRRPGSVGIHPSDTLSYVRGHGHPPLPPRGGAAAEVFPASKELWAMADACNVQNPIMGMFNSR